MNGLWIGILLTLAPLTELRVGLPLALIHSIENNIPTFLTFSLILILNILLIFILFFFLDRIHNRLLNWKFYSKAFHSYLDRIQNRVHKFEKRHNSLGTLALVLLVGVPLPFTGAYTGVFLSWILNLNRKKSILGIALGVSMAGIIIYLFSLGLLNTL